MTARGKRPAPKRDKRAPREVFVQVGRTDDGREYESPYSEQEALRRLRAWERSQAGIDEAERRGALT